MQLVAAAWKALGTLSFDSRKPASKAAHCTDVGKEHRGAIRHRTDAVSGSEGLTRQGMSLAPTDEQASITEPGETLDPDQFHDMTLDDASLTVGRNLNHTHFSARTDRLPIHGLFLVLLLIERPRHLGACFAAGVHNAGQRRRTFNLHLAEQKFMLGIGERTPRHHQ